VLRSHLGNTWATIWINERAAIDDPQHNSAYYLAHIIIEATKGEFTLSGRPAQRVSGLVIILYDIARSKDNNGASLKMYRRKVERERSLV